METWLYEIRLICRNEITDEPHFHLYTTDPAKAQAFYYGLESIGERETYAYNALDPDGLPLCKPCDDARRRFVNADLYPSRTVPSMWTPDV